MKNTTQRVILRSIGVGNAKYGRDEMANTKVNLDNIWYREHYSKLVRVLDEHRILTSSDIGRIFKEDQSLALRKLRGGTIPVKGRQTPTEKSMDEPAQGTLFPGP